MQKNNDRWPRVDAVILIVVSLALVGVITGSILVGTAKRASYYLSPIENAAYPGGVTAAVCAAVVLLGTLFLRGRDAILVQLLITCLLFLLPVNAAFTTSRRAASALESPNSDVYTGQYLFVLAAGLMAAAIVVGIVKVQLLKRRKLRG